VSDPKSFGALGFGYIIPASFLPALTKQLIHDSEVFGWSGRSSDSPPSCRRSQYRCCEKRTDNGALWMGSALAMAMGCRDAGAISRNHSDYARRLPVGGTFAVITMIGTQRRAKPAARRLPS
jgi:hypothetical protein